MLVSKLFLHTIKLVTGQPVILEVRKSEEGEQLMARLPKATSLLETEVKKL